MARYWDVEDFKGKSESQIKEHLDLQARLVARENMDELARKSSTYPAWTATVESLTAGQRATRQGMGLGMHVLGKVGLADAEWQSKDSREFRYASLPLFRGYGTFVHSFFEEFQKNPAAAMTPATGGLAGVLARAAKKTADEGALGFPWAQTKEGSEWVESAALNTLDPMIASGYMSSLGKAAFAAPEIRNLIPFAEAAMGAADHPSVIAALQPTWAKDASSPLFFRAFREATLHNAVAGDAAAGVRNMAAWMYQQGIRSSDWAQTAAMPVTELFKRGGNLASPKAMKTLMAVFGDVEGPGRMAADSLKKAGHEAVGTRWEALMQSFHDRFEQAYAALPDITDKEKAAIDWLEQNIPRMGDTAEARVKSFRTYLAEAQGPKGLRLGSYVEAADPELVIKPGDIAKYRSTPSTLKVEAADPLLKIGPSDVEGRTISSSAGMSNPVEITGKPASSGADATGMHNKVTHSWLGNDRRTVFAPHFDEATIAKAEKYIGHLSGGYMDSRGYGYNPTYSVSAAKASRINKGLADAMEGIEELTERGWEMHRKGKAGIIKAIDNVKNWHASVATRDGFAKDLASLTKELKDRAKVVSAAAEQGGANAESLKAEAAMLEHAAATVNYYGLNPDFVSWAKPMWEDASAAKKATIIAKASFEAYMKGLQHLKTAILLPMPGFWLHRIQDMAGFRSLIETGDTVMAKSLKAMYEGEAAPVLSAVGNKVLGVAKETANTQFGVMRHPETWFGKALQRTRDAMDALDNTALDHILKSHYDQAAAELAALGHTAEVVHEGATKAGMKAVDLVHGMYTSRSPAMNLMRAAAFFPDHYIGSATHMMTRALEHPPEAYALLRLRERMQRTSFGRDGQLQVPHTDFAWDPLKRTVPGRIMDSLLNGGKILNSQDRFEWKVMKGMSLLAGPLNPPAQWAAEQVGLVEPASPRGTMVERMASNLGRYLGADIGSFSDGVSALMGTDPGENSKLSAERKAMSVYGAAQYAKAPITPQEAVHASALADLKSEVISYLSGQTVSYSPPGMNEVKANLYDYRDKMTQVEPQNRAAAANGMRAEPRFQPIYNLLPNDPGAKFTGLTFLGNSEEARIEAYLSDPNRRTDFGDGRFAPAVDPTPKEKLDRLKTLEDAIKSSPLGWILDATATKAGAVELHTPMVENLPEPDIFTKGTKGGIAIATYPGITVEEINRRADVLNQFNMMEPELRVQPRLQALHDYISAANNNVIENGVQKTTNPILDVLRASAKFDDKSRLYLAAYDHVQSNGATPLSQGLPPGLVGTEMGQANWYKNLVGNSRPADANWLVDAKPEEVLRAIQAKDPRIGELAVGTTADNYGIYEVRKMQEAAHTMVGVAQSKWDLKQKQAYPEMGKFVGMLQDAVRPGPAQEGKLQDAIAFGEAGMRRGTLPPNAYEEVKSPQYRDLYERVENAAMVHGTSSVWEFINFKDPMTGRMTGRVNPVALQEIAANPRYNAWRPEIQQLASGRAGDYHANAIANAVQELHPIAREEVQANLVANPEVLDAHRTENFNSMTGRIHPDLSQLLTGMFGQGETFGGSGFARAISTPAAKEVPNFVTASDSQGRALPPVSRDPIGKSSNRPYGEFYAGTDTPKSGINSPARFMAASWGAYQKEVASHREGTPPPSYASNVAQTWDSMDGAEKTRTGASAVGTAYQAANMINQLSGGDEFPAEVQGAAAAFQTSFSIYASSGFNPYSLIVAIPMGVMQGVLTSNQAGERDEQRKKIQKSKDDYLAIENARRLEAERQQSIRDLTGRESRLAKLMPAMTPQQKAAIEPHLATFQRRPTFQSRLGLVDAAERAVGTALRPRW